MSVILRTGFQSVTHNINFQPQTQLKGKKLVSAQHVRDVEELKTKYSESSIIQARVIRQTSISSTPYKTSLSVNAARVITNSKCNCVYNQSGRCKHIAALIYYVNYEESRSKTSHEQVWGKPSANQFAKQKYCKGRNFDQMFPKAKKRRANQPNNHTTLHPSEIIDQSSLKSVIELEAKVGDKLDITKVKQRLLNVVNLENEECVACVTTFLILIEEFEVYKCQYELEQHLQEFYNEKLNVSEENIIHLCCKTIRQSTCKDWYALRHLRVSASTNVHNIKIRKTKSIDSLVSSILHPSRIQCEATRYGTNNERRALEEYQRLHNCKVKLVGSIISKHQPWLCASLDGVVVEDACIKRLVEFKCPIICKKIPVIDHDKKLCNVPYLEFINGEVELKKSHIYYTQVQTQMYVTGMTVCDLFIYSPIENGSCRVSIHRDEDFIQHAILSCEKFYFEHYLQALYLEDKVKNDINNNMNPQRPCFTGKDIRNIIKI